jgi:hypothetical protein
MALTDGIVGCWSPSLGASGYRLLDRSRYSNHGTLTNMDAGTDWVGTSAGLALDYDGTNDYVVTSYGVPVTSCTMSVSVWLIRRATSGVFPRIADISDGTNSLQLILDLGSGGSNFFVTKHTQYQSGTTATQWGFATTVSTLEHIAVTVDSLASTARVWWNGVEQTAASNNNAGAGVASRAVYFGARRDLNAVTHFAGVLGETAIYSRALTGAEVRELYRQGNGAIGRALTGQTRRRTYGFVAATGARRRRIITGMV